MKFQYKYLEWDEYNLWKNEIKHGVTAEEIEQCFNNPPFILFPHKKIADRRVLLGRTFHAYPVRTGLFGSTQFACLCALS